MSNTGRTSVDAESPRPRTLATSQEIRDRGSTFVGYVYRARAVEEARAVLGRLPGAAGSGSGLARLKSGGGGEEGDGDGDGGGDRGTRVDVDVDASASAIRTRKLSGASRVHGLGRGSGDDGDKRGPYMIAAWRCMVVKSGRTGLGGPDDFTVQEGCDDGEERWAGGRVLSVMKREGVMDAVVVVCRWFGGTLLGPARFNHIETCASEVCRRFNKIEEMDECIQTLRTLDDLLATLRAELATARTGTLNSSGSAENSRARRAPDYRAMQDSLDLTRAKRLINARECSIEATKTLIEKCKTST